jgi:ribonuclease Z
MFELVFLGTSASAPSIQRGLSANLVLYKNYRFLIDCGEGTQRQLLKSGLGFRRLDKILLTHGHLDHILGLGGLASTFSRWEAMDRLDIYGGESALSRVRTLIEDVVLGPNEPNLNLSYHRLSPGLIFEDKTFTLSAIPVQHRGGGCFGFVFEEKSRRPFLADKAEALNIPHGPERRDLVAGQTITLADGRVIQPDEVLGDPLQGTKLVFIADVAETASLIETAQQATALVIEATYLQEDVEMARRYGHITAAEAATLAQQAGVETLYLTHLSRRYRDREILAEAQAIFPNTILAQDLAHYAISAKN